MLVGLSIGFHLFDQSHMLLYLSFLAVASNFKDCDPTFQTEALEKLSIEHQFVVSTGGGAVIRDENWYDCGHYN